MVASDRTHIEIDSNIVVQLMFVKVKVKVQLHLTTAFDQSATLVR